MPPAKVNLAEKFNQIPEPWQPRLAAEVGDCQVKLAKLAGEFEWHSHAEQEEIFLVVAGRLCLRFRDGEVWLAPGEFLTIPRGVEHLPVAPEETCVVLIEPKGVVNTGENQDSPRRLEKLDWI